MRRYDGIDQDSQAFEAVDPDYMFKQSAKDKMQSNSGSWGRHSLRMKAFSVLEGPQLGLTRQK